MNLFFLLFCVSAFLCLIFTTLYFRSKNRLGKIPVWFHSPQSVQELRWLIKRQKICDPFSGVPLRIPEEEGFHTISIGRPNERPLHILVNGKTFSSFTSLTDFTFLTEEDEEMLNDGEGLYKHRQILRIPLRPRKKKIRCFVCREDSVSDFLKEQREQHETSLLPIEEMDSDYLFYLILFSDVGTYEEFLKDPVVLFQRLVPFQQNFWLN